MLGWPGPEFFGLLPSEIHRVVATDHRPHFLLEFQPSQIPHRFPILDSIVGSRQQALRRSRLATDLERKVSTSAVVQSGSRTTLFAPSVRLGLFWASILRLELITVACPSQAGFLAIEIIAQMVAGQIGSPDEAQRMSACRRHQGEGNLVSWTLTLQTCLWRYCRARGTWRDFINATRLTVLSVPDSRLHRVMKFNILLSVGTGVPCGRATLRSPSGKAGWLLARNVENIRLSEAAIGPVGSRGIPGHFTFSLVSPYYAGMRTRDSGGQGGSSTQKAFYPTFSPNWQHSTHGAGPRAAQPL
jgi:hypothetical protein